MAELNLVLQKLETRKASSPVKSCASELRKLCDTNILWYQAVFEVFYNPGKFSLREEVFGWLLADSVCCRSFLQALEFSNLGEESFDHRQEVLSGCEL